MSEEIKKYYIIPNDKNLDLYKSNSFILPLEKYSVGFDVYFNIDEINDLANIYDISILINKFIHKEELEEIENVISKFNNIKYIFIEDLGLTALIENEKIVLYPNHIISNYESVNFLYESNYKNVVISNELTIDEIEEIINKTKSNLFYFYINKNTLMYSRRNLVTNYNKHFNIIDNGKTSMIEEVVSKKKLIIKEEENLTNIFYDNIFCASKYFDKLKNINLIINFNNISNEDKNTILNNLYNEDLSKLLKSDNRFLEEKIVYKVGDLNV